MGVLSLLAGGVSGLSGGAGVATPLTPDVVTVSPNVTASISAPFAVGRGARATTVDPLSDPRAPLTAGIAAGGGSGVLLLLAAAVAAVFVLRKR